MADNFDDILSRITKQLQEEKRISYRLLKRRFELDDEKIEDVKDELIHAKRIATDDNDRVLVWREQAAAPEVKQAERRHLTVAFFDLADSTQFSSALDPEDFRDIILTYQRIVVSAVLPYEGYIAQYLGDGVLVYFGYPSAREDDAQRALEASLDVIETFKETARDLKLRYGMEPAIRVGIHSGVVVMGDVGGASRTEQIAIGDTPNIAARLQGEADLNQIVVGGDTYNLVKYLFEFDFRGELQLKGIPEPVKAYTCAKRLSGRGKFQVLVQKSLTELQGREQETRQLTALWRQAVAGESAAISLAGEGGIGKTRLVLDVSNQLLEQGGERHLIECSPFHQGSYLFPIISYLESKFEFFDSESPEQKYNKLISGLADYECADAECLALLGSLLAVDKARLPPLDYTPRRQRELTHEALISLIREDAARNPCFYIFDDLHWCDPSTLEFLSMLIREKVPGTLFAMTFRPGFEHRWEGTSHIELGQISVAEAEGIVRSTDRLGMLDDETVREIVARSDGIPLFLEELTQAVLSQQQSVSADNKPAQIQIPSSLRDSLFARLDRLPSGKKIAQLAAVIGRDFSQEMLGVIWAGRDEDLQTGLHELTGSGLLEQHRNDRQLFYTFKHALIRDTAYESLLIRRRQQYHLLIAYKIESRFVHMKTSQPEVLAHHFTAGLEYKKALEYWRKSSSRAQRRSAHVEAVNHLRKALEVLQLVRSIGDKAQLESELLIQKGTNLIAIKGYASSHVGDVYTRAYELCSAIEDWKTQFDVVQGLWAFYLVRGDLERALELSDELERISAINQQEEFMLEALLRQGISLSMLGDLHAAREKFEQVLSMYDIERDSRHRMQYGQDPMVSCLCHFSLVLWLLGYPEQALARCQQACELAEEMAHPFTLSWAYLYTALVHYLRREKKQSIAATEKLVRLSTDQAFAYRLAQGRIMAGWAAEDAEQGSGMINEALAAVRATGALVFATYYFAILAEVESKNSFHSAMATLEQGIQLADETHERIFHAELLRFKAQLLIDEHKQLDSARALLAQSQQLAEQQGAHAVLLRIAMSNYQLENTVEARQQLADCLQNIPEGPALKDYQEAVALLDVG